MARDCTQPDAELVRLAQSGELPAFDALARRYQPTVLRFLRRRLPDSDVEDVAQESFVRAYERLHLCRPDASFKSWLLAIVYRKMIDHLRRPVLKIESAELSSRDDPSQQAGEQEDRAMLWSTARQVLTDDQYSAVWLFYAEDLPAAEIARIMGRSWVSTKVLLHRARAKLADATVIRKLGAVSNVVKAGEA